MAAVRVLWQKLRHTTSDISRGPTPAQAQCTIHTEQLPRNSYRTNTSSHTNTKAGSYPGSDLREAISSVRAYLADSFPGPISPQI